MKVFTESHLADLVVAQLGKRFRNAVSMACDECGARVRATVVFGPENDQRMVCHTCLCQATTMLESFFRLPNHVPCANCRGLIREDALCENCGLTGCLFCNSCCESNDQHPDARL